MFMNLIDSNINKEQCVKTYVGCSAYQTLVCNSSKGQNHIKFTFDRIHDRCGRKLKASFINTDLFL